jgi:hypothetical protein
VGLTLSNTISLDEVIEGFRLTPGRAYTSTFRAASTTGTTAQGSVSLGHDRPRILRDVWMRQGVVAHSGVDVGVSVSTGIDRTPHEAHTQ